MPEGFNPAVLPSTPIAHPEQGVAFVDGQFIPAGDATVSVFDFGFTRSDVTYDVVHVFGGKFFRLNHHLDRFEASMKALRYTIPYDREGIRAIVKECVRRTGLVDAWVGLVCTRGRPPKNSRDPRTCENRFIAYAVPPVWIAAVWFGFGTLPNASLAWLKGRWKTQAILGALSGPLTYWAGVKLGAATLPDPGAAGALFAIGLAWALALPAIFLMAEAISPVALRAPAHLS
jgi:hypothetical protein